MTDGAPAGPGVVATMATEEHLTFWGRCKRLKATFLIMFLTGFVIAIPSSIIPMLQMEVFGQDMFSVTGGLSACKGFLGFLYMPILGAFTDLHGRKAALLVVLALSIFPYTLMLIWGFWHYSIANTFLGLYNATMALLMAIAVDLLGPNMRRIRTESFAMLMASFFLGVSTAPFLGAYLTTSQTFMLATGMQLLTVIVAAVVIPSSMRPPSGNAPSGVAAGGCPFRRRQGSLAAGGGDPAAAGEAAFPTRRNSTPFAIPGFDRCETEKLLDGESSRTDINRCPFLRAVVAPRDNGSDTTRSSHGNSEDGDDGERQMANPDAETAPATAVAAVPRGDPQTPNKNNATAMAPTAADTTTIAVTEGPAEAFADPHALPVRVRSARLVWATLKAHPDIRVLTAAIFFNSLTEQIFDKLLFVYLTSPPLNFGPTRQAIVITILGVGGTIGLMFTTGWLKHFFGTLNTLRISLLANGVVAIIYGFATVDWLIYLSTALSVVGMAAFPCAAALAANSVDRDSAGIAQGLVASAQMAAAGISPLLFGFVFQAVMNFSIPGIGFLIGAFCVVVSCIMTFGLSAGMKRERHH